MNDKRKHLFHSVLSCVYASLYVCLAVRPSIGLISWSAARYVGINQIVSLYCNGRCVRGCTVCTTTCPTYMLYVSVPAHKPVYVRMCWLICQRGRQSVLWATGLNPFVYRHVCMTVCVWVCVWRSEPAAAVSQVSACEGVGGSVEASAGSRLTWTVCLGLSLNNWVWILYLCLCPWVSISLSKCTCVFAV